MNNINKITHIDPSVNFFRATVLEVYQSLDLLIFLVWRNIKIRYTQTVLGALWAVLQPFLTMVVFSVFFGKFAKVGPDGLPYSIWSFCALVPWFFFSDGISRGSNSIVGNQNLIKKIYFPRILLPISENIAVFLDFTIGFIFLLLMGCVYGYFPNISFLWFLPYSIFIAFISSVSASVFFSALNVKFRDVRYVVPFFVQLLMFISPVVYTVKMIPSSIEIFGRELPLISLYYLNPMAGVIESVRFSMLGVNQPSYFNLALSASTACTCSIFSMWFFFKKESEFADIV